VKPKITSTRNNLFRVIDIPQNDYGIPHKTSINRYVPYSSNLYKEKTYIYIEGEETDDYSYVRVISSSDITSSSEGEYEEMDINDIYPYKSPTYKTLIEVVLKPSIKNEEAHNTEDAQDILIENMEDTNDTPTNKLTDEEWNKLRNDFISQYLKDLPNGMDYQLPNEYTVDDNIYMDIEPNILHDSMDEKPFITQIQDRDLHNGKQITYDINWNIQKRNEKLLVILQMIRNIFQIMIYILE
ncbi:hypothetical protein PFMALIP_00664, partial [Plasmodium falciparum MaliPS096_E11]